jgi:hypothetical protein
MDRQRWTELQSQPRRVQAIGVDVAAGGRDNTCWTLIDEHGVIDQIVMNLANTMEIVGRTIALIDEHTISSQRVAMDAGGGGKQLADRLSERNYPVTLVGFGEAARARHTYLNRRAEMYGILRERLKAEGDKGQFVLPPDAQELARELQILPLLYDSEGRLLLPPKRRASTRPGEITIEGLLGRSPDRADSLALAVWMLDRYRGIAKPSFHVHCGPIELSAEQYAAMPKELRDICEAHDRMEREYKARKFWGEDW